MKDKDNGKMLNGFLTKNQRKYIGGVLLLIGFFLATPPFIPSPDDFLNIIVAGFLSKSFSIPVFTGLLYSYTIIAWGLLAAGIIIYPERDGVLMTKLNRKIKKSIRHQFRKMKADKKYMLLVIVVVMVMIYIYMNILSGML